MSWILIVLAHWNNSLWVDMSLHSDPLFWLRANQYFLFLLNAACFAEKQQIPILKSLVWPDLGSNPWSTALETSTLTIITPQMQFRWKKEETHYIVPKYHHFLAVRTKSETRGNQLMKTFISVTKLQQFHLLLIVQLLYLQYFVRVHFVGHDYKV
jgi:hypothetical protein